MSVPGGGGGVCVFNPESRIFREAIGFKPQPSPLFSYFSIKTCYIIERSNYSSDAELVGAGIFIFKPEFRDASGEKYDMPL